MKKGKHPKTYPITLVLTDGSEVQVQSTIGKKDSMVKIQLESDPLVHPAWNPGRRVVARKNSRASRFMEKFGDIL